MNNRSREPWGPYPLILAGAALAVLVSVLADPEWGGFMLGAVLLVGAALRFAGYGGPLAVRKKSTDVITLAGLGLLLAVAAMFLEYPQLKTELVDLFVR